MKFMRSVFTLHTSAETCQMLSVHQVALRLLQRRLERGYSVSTLLTAQLTILLGSSVSSCMSSMLVTRRT